MKIELKKVINCISLLIFANISLTFAKDYNIDYCGVNSSQIDANMSKITSDLYFNQLSEIQDFTVSDKRTQFSDNFNSENFSDSSISFFVEISKNDTSDKWYTVFHVINGSTKEEVTKSKEYDSYYKILMEPKAILQNTIKELIENNISTVTSDSGSKQNVASVTSESAVSTEFLSGSWKGEDFINKIVIMKGGRGFVIFNNGASMNISIKLTKQDDIKKITITQNQRSNASYFPNLPRQTALEHAVNAEPITWTFTEIDSNSLKGEKRTLSETQGSIAYVNIPVEWNRIN